MAVSAQTHGRTCVSRFTAQASPIVINETTWESERVSLMDGPGGLYATIDPIYSVSYRHIVRLALQVSNISRRRRHCGKFPVYMRDVDAICDMACSVCDTI